MSSTTTTGDIEVILPEDSQDKIEIVELDIGTELAIESPIEEIEISVSGNSVLVGEPISGSTVTVDASSNKETVTLDLNNSGFEKSDVVVQKGAAEINVNVGTFKKSTVATGKKSDSVTFGNQTTVDKSTMELGKGSDAVTFGDQTTVDTTTMVMGTGSDSVIFGNESTVNKATV